MAHDLPGTLFDRFAAAAERAAARPDVDPDLAREVFLEAATLLHNGLALDHLDKHDHGVVVEALCADLVADDPGAAVRARAAAVPEMRGRLHDPDGVAAAYLVAANILQL